MRIQTFEQRVDKGVDPQPAIGLQFAENAEDGAVPQRNLATLHGAPVTVRHFAADHSVFVGNDYLIKGVAGAVLWKLLNAYVSERRSEFTNGYVCVNS